MLTAMNILYVDDEKDLLELASTFFEDEKIPLDVASDFSQALELLRAKKYDLIIADIRMPSGSGIELVSRARAEFAFKGKFILVSGDIKPGDSYPGCDLTMNKPLDFFLLIDSVKGLLQNK